MDRITSGFQVEDFDEYVNGDKKGVIELAVPVVDSHSWWNNCMPALQTVLGMDTAQIRKLVYFIEGVKDGEIVGQRDIDLALTGADAIEALLKKVDLDAIYKEARDTERTQMVRLEFLDADAEEEDEGEKEEDADDGDPRVEDHPADNTDPSEYEYVEETEPELTEKEKERCDACRKLREARKMIDATLFLKRGRWKIDSIRILPVQLRNILREESRKYPYRAYFDISSLYRRVIDRNARLVRLTKMDAPGIILRNERRILQEMVDELYANGNCPGGEDSAVKHRDGTKYACIDDIILQNVPRW